MSAIVTHDLVRVYPPALRAVDGINLDIPEGSVFGFLGQNGSGKTTTVRMLTTLLKPTSGEATVGGVNVIEHPAEVRKRVGVALQEVGLDNLQTGREVLTLQARLFGIDPREARRRVTRLLEVVTLDDAADRSIKGYSGGMRRRLDLACALVNEPRIVFLDEPTTGLDPITREGIWQYVVELNQREGVTFFLTTQYLEEADRLADEVAIMDRGKIVAQGKPADLKAAIAADAVTLTFRDGKRALADAQEPLRAFEGVEDLQVSDDHLIVYVRNGAAAIANIVRLMDDAGLAVAELRLTQPTLDDVFLRATGHQLKVDEKPSEGHS